MKAPKNPRATIGRRVRVPYREGRASRLGKIEGPDSLYTAYVHVMGEITQNTGLYPWSDLEPYGPEWDEKPRAGDKPPQDLRSYMKALELQESHEKFAAAGAIRRHSGALRWWSDIDYRPTAKQLATSNNERKDEMNHVAQAILDEKGSLTKDQADVIKAFADVEFDNKEFEQWFFLKFIDDKDLLEAARACLARREEEAKR